VPYSILGLEEWKSAARAGQPPVGAVLRKQFVPDTAKDAGGRRVSFTISTGAIDRARDTIAVDGWHLDAYRQNPVVLWGHQSGDLPLGVAESVGVSAGRLKATVRFAEPGKDYQTDEWPSHLPTPETVLSMIRGGFLRATSVGFLPVTSAWNDKRGGVDFMEQELLEFSIVPVPANAEALQDARAKGFDVAPFVSELKRCLDSFEPGTWLPRDEAEAALRSIAAPRVVAAALDFAVAVGKAGRVLSAANEDRIRAARDAGTAIGEQLDQVLAQVQAAAAAAPPVETKTPEPVLWVRPSAPRFVIDPRVVREAVSAAVVEAVRKQVNEARGRLD